MAFLVYGALSFYRLSGKKVTTISCTMSIFLDQFAYLFMKFQEMLNFEHTCKQIVNNHNTIHLFK